MSAPTVIGILNILLFLIIVLDLWPIQNWAEMKSRWAGFCRSHKPPASRGLDWVFRDDQGWWFEDETGAYATGPFDSEKKARAHFEAYVDWLEFAERAVTWTIPENGLPGWYFVDGHGISHGPFLCVKDAKAHRTFTEKFGDPGMYGMYHSAKVEASYETQVDEQPENRVPCLADAKVVEDADSGERLLIKSYVSSILSTGSRVGVAFLATGSVAVEIVRNDNHVTAFLLSEEAREALVRLLLQVEALT